LQRSDLSRRHALEDQLDRRGLDGGRSLPDAFRDGARCHLAQRQNPPARWAAKYALPADCIRLRRLNDVPLLVLPETFYEVAADTDTTGATINVILSNASPLAAIYTARVTDPLRWDQGFVDAIVYGLASRICFELSGKEERARALSQMWQTAVRDAVAASANEGSALNRTYVPDAIAVRT
jgi:hypothetical protein